MKAKTRTLYVRPNDVDVWQDAENLAMQRSVSISTLVAEALRLVLDKYEPVTTERKKSA